MESEKMHITTVTNKGIKYISEEWWINRGKYHREDGPAIIKYDENGNIESEYWYKNDRLIGEIIYNNSLKCRESWRKYGGYHWEIDYYNSGKIRSEFYYKKKYLFREDGPAVIHYYENGNVKREHWHNNKGTHRNNKPAIIYYYENGNIKEEWWCKNGKLHKEDGPAVIEYDEDQKIINQKFYLNGKEADELQQIIIATK